MHLGSTQQASTSRAIARAEDASEQQAEASERQKNLDEIERHDADAFRCRREAERKVKIEIPGAGGWSLRGAQGTMEIVVGSDWELYRSCMERSGWKTPIIIDRTRTDIRK